MSRQEQDVGLFKKAWNKVRPTFLGGDVVATLGSVQGEPAMGSTADLMKATGEIRVHRVRTPEDAPLVTLEWVQAQVPGDGKHLTCIRLPPSEAVRLGDMLREAAGD